MTKSKYDLSTIFEPQNAHPDESHSIQMRYIPAKSHVLELGCSTGYMSAYMEESLGCRVTGLEYDAEAAAVARSRCHEVFVLDLDTENALKPAQVSAPYDVALIANVLEHLKYPERVLADVNGLLKPNASLILVLPNIAYWKYRLRLLLGKFDYEDYGVMDRTHLHFYTVKTGRALVEAAGFELEDFAISGSLLQIGLNVLARRLKRPLPKAVLANLFGYELIYIARKKTNV